MNEFEAENKTNGGEVNWKIWGILHVNKLCQHYMYNIICHQKMYSLTCNTASRPSIWDGSLAYLNGYDAS